MHDLLPDEFLLLAAVADGQQAIAAWERWRAAALPLTPFRSRILPLIYRNLLRNGVPESDIAVDCRRVYASAWVRMRLLLREVRRVAGALSGEGIDTLFLKGVALAAAYYGDAGMRVMSDFDMVVPRRDAARCVRLLEAAGWSAAVPFAESDMAMRHAVEFRRGEWKCDLHWAIFWEALDEDATVAFRDSAESAELEGLSIRIPRPEHLLLHLIVHGTRRCETGQLRWVPDAMVVLERRGEDFDWDLFAAEVESRSFEFPVGEALAYLSRVFDAAIPSTILERLESVPSEAMRRIYEVRPAQSERERPLEFLRPLRYRFALQSRGRGARGRLQWIARHLQYSWRVPTAGKLIPEFARRVRVKVTQLIAPRRKAARARD